MGSYIVVIMLGISKIFDSLVVITAVAVYVLGSPTMDLND